MTDIVRLPVGSPINNQRSERPIFTNCHQQLQKLQRQNVENGKWARKWVGLLSTAAENALSLSLCRKLVYKLESNFVILHIQLARKKE